MNIKNTVYALALAAIVLILFCLRLWQPERQVLKHQENLLKAASARNWPRMAEFIDGKYSDRWGHDKTSVLSDSREVLSQFLVLEITGASIETTVTGGVGTVSCRLKMVGRGSPVGEVVMSEINGLKTPFTFQWTCQSWKPWDWNLTLVDNPGLNIPQGF